MKVFGVQPIYIQFDVEGSQGYKEPPDGFVEDTHVAAFSLRCVNLIVWHIRWTWVYTSWAHPDREMLNPSASHWAVEDLAEICLFSGKALVCQSGQEIYIRRTLHSGPVCGRSSRSYRHTLSVSEPS